MKFFAAAAVAVLAVLLSLPSPGPRVVELPAGTFELHHEMLVAGGKELRGSPSGTVLRAAAGTRLRPIVMTTMAMVFGMLPLSLGLAEGAEFRRSMGTVLIGGLLSSLILTLFLVPVIYTWVVGFIDKRAARRVLRVDEDHDEDVGEWRPPALPTQAR